MASSKDEVKLEAAVEGNVEDQRELSSVGYTYMFLEGPDLDKYTCPICCYVAWNPYQVTCCGHIYCKTCLESLKKEAPSFKCPTCTRALTNCDYFSDKRAQLDINLLKVFCPNNNQKPGPEEGNTSCDWKGELMYVKTHVQSCLYQLMLCQCDDKFNCKDLPTHQSETTVFIILSNVIIVC